MVNTKRVQLNHYVTQGFTLIELLVVLFIVSIFITAVSLRVMQNTTFESKQTAKRLYALFGLAQQAALLQPGVFAFQSRDNGYEFLEYQIDRTTWQGKWTQAPDNYPLLQYHHLPNNVVIYLTFPEKNKSSNVLISNNGELTPFTLAIGPKGKSPLYQLIGSANGSLQLVAAQ